MPVFLNLIAVCEGHLILISVFNVYVAPSCLVPWLRYLVRTELITAYAVFKLRTWIGSDFVRERSSNIRHNTTVIRNAASVPVNGEEPETESTVVSSSIAVVTAIQLATMLGLASIPRLRESSGPMSTRHTNIKKILLLI